MKKLYGIIETDGEIISVCPPDDIGGRDAVEVVENPTWEVSDFTDRSTGTNYIRTDRLAFLFDELCAKTGMKKKALAERCGKSVVTFSRYCNGVIPVPPLVWEKVEEITKL